MDCSPPGSSVRGVLQAGILEWVVMPSFRGSFLLRDRTRVSGIAGRFFTTPTYVYLWLIHVDVWQKSNQYVNRSSFN